jgi:glycosyltransferase involved in cell wall biosynthesis
MKILQVILAFPPSEGYGGAPVVAYEISKKLVQRGHEVTVYTTDANNKESRLSTKNKHMDGFEVYYFKNISNSMAYNYRITFSPKMIYFMKNVREFDVVHIHDFRTFPSIMTHHYCRKFHVPYILQPHGKPPLVNDKRARSLKQLFDLLIGNKILQDTSKLLALNYTEAKLYETRVEKRNIEIIPNAVDLSKYSNLPKKNTFKDKCKISDDDYLILYLGRIHETKGLKLLFESFFNLSTKIEKIKLIVIGSDDGYLNYLKNMSNSLNIADKVIFTGFLNHEEKLSAYVDADVFVTPTFYGFPLTFLEAMACGLPIITTDKGDFIEGIDNEIGYVTRYDEKELKNALLKVLTDDELRERFKENAKKKSNEYSWDRIGENLEKVYEEVIR